MENELSQKLVMLVVSPHSEKELSLPVQLTSCASALKLPDGSDNAVPMKIPKMSHSIT